LPVHSVAITQGTMLATLRRRNRVGCQLPPSPGSEDTRPWFTGERRPS
jgi:hypothetical protein